MVATQLTVSFISLHLQAHSCQLLNNQQQQAAPLVLVLQNTCQFDLLVKVTRATQYQVNFYDQSGFLIHEQTNVTVLPLPILVSLNDKFVLTTRQSTIAFKFTDIDVFNQFPAAVFING